MSHNPGTLLAIGGLAWSGVVLSGGVATLPMGGGGIGDW